MNHDLLIRSGSVVDGTGAPARRADVAIQGDRIVAIGSELGDARETLDAVEKIQVDRSEVMSFHDYNWPEQFERRAKQMLSYGRPVLATEYMARGNGSTFDGSLPIAKRMNIAMINWGFVDGKTQTRLPWDSWKKPYTYDEPTIWFHDVLRSDGTAYRQAEVDQLRDALRVDHDVVGLDVAVDQPVPFGVNQRPGDLQNQIRGFG